jgi:hypothetical protein
MDSLVVKMVGDICGRDIGQSLWTPEMKLFAFNPGTKEKTETHLIINVLNCEMCRSREKSDDKTVPENSQAKRERGPELKKNSDKGQQQAKNVRN